MSQFAPQIQNSSKLDNKMKKRNLKFGYEKYFSVDLQDENDNELELLKNTPTISLPYVTVAAQTYKSIRADESCNNKSCKKRSTLARSKSTYSGASKDVAWPFPYFARQRRRYAMMEHIYSLGYVLTYGIKFGGEFLAYPGDPSSYHACFV